MNAVIAADQSKASKRRSMAKSTQDIRKRTPEHSRLGAEESSATGVLDQEAAEEVDSRLDPAQAVKVAQKRRFAELDRATLKSIYRQMLLVRRFEEKSAEAYSAGKIGGFCHLYIGQEAVAIGAISAIRKDDYVLTSYREHAHAIAKGMSPESVMAALYGRGGGRVQGQGGTHDT